MSAHRRPARLPIDCGGEVVVDGGTYQVVSSGHRDAVEYARSHVHESFAAALADRGSEARALCGGDWRYWRRAIDDLCEANERVTIGKPYAWCVRRIQGLTAHGIPTTRDVAIPARLPPSATIPMSADAPAAAARLNATQANQQRMRNAFSKVNPDRLKDIS